MSIEQVGLLSLSTFGRLSSLEIATGALDLVRSERERIKKEEGDERLIVSPNVAAISLIVGEAQWLMGQGMIRSHFGGELIKSFTPKSKEKFSKGVGGKLFGVIIRSLGRGAVEGWKDEIAVEEYNDAFNETPISRLTLGRLTLESPKYSRQTPEEETVNIRKELSTKKGKTFLGFFEDKSKLPRSLRRLWSIDETYGPVIDDAVSTYKETLSYLTGPRIL